MIKLAKMTDYAVIVLADMAGHAALMSASEIAERTELPEPTVSKILKALAKHKIVASTRGSSGGYALNMKPEEISMADVVSATDGPIALTACVDEGSSCCDRSHSCSMKGQWNPVNLAMQNALENVSLQQMMGSGQ